MSQSLPLRRILIFWAPLFSTWLMMAFEGPFLAAIIARLPEPKFNLAAHGVAFSLALIVEAPIIMMMSASTALVHSRQSYLALRNFTARLNVAITAIMLLLGVPAVFSALMESAIGLLGEVSWRAHLAVLLLLPWPAAIGFRRFYQGLLIRRNRTREVAYGTVLRLTSMTGTALLLTAFTRIEGVAVGAASLSVGVVAEALASRWMVRRIVPDLLRNAGADPAAPPLTNRGIWAFYYPLIITSVLTLAAQPLITFFVGTSRMAIESLAVLPVVNALVMVFRSIGLSYQEVAVAFMVQEPHTERSVRSVAGILATVAGGGLLLIAFTNAAGFWFGAVSGLSPDLAAVATIPLQLLGAYPALETWLSLQRGLLISRRRTRPLTLATGLEFFVVAVMLFAGIRMLDLIGATAAALALIVGRLAANGYLVLPVSRSSRGSVTETG